MQHHVDRIKTFWYTEDDFETNNSPKKYSVSPNLSDVYVNLFYEILN
jgi:hypothetical protein